MRHDPLPHLRRPPPHRPRHFLPDRFNPGDWREAEPLYRELLDRPLPDREAYRKWIGDRGELESALSEEGSRLYISMTCDTSDRERAEDFARFTEEIEPKIAPLSHLLNRKMVEHPEATEAEREFPVWFRSVRSAIALFREENVPIETEAALEVQRYQQLTGQQTALFDGEEQTLVRLTALLEEKDRSLRERAWRAAAERRLLDRDRLDTHFETLFSLRNRISRNGGFENFVDYIFEAKGRWDYTPGDCRSFHSAVETGVVPLYRKVLARRAKEMGLDRLRPWDLSCDPLGRERLRPFGSGEELERLAATLFEAVSPLFSRHFSEMREKRLLDLENRPGKAPGGYQSGLEEWRLPFIFMNAIGTVGDLFTLLHEGGHSFHQFEMAPLDLPAHRSPPLEFAEVASMSMELMGLERLDTLFDPETVSRIRREQLEEIPGLLCWIARIDAFQHWLYTRPDHTREERTRCWLDLERRFGPGEIVDGEGLEEYTASGWQKQLHLFEVPFYYIEYGIAQLGALQVWRCYRKNPVEAVEGYLRGLRLGGTASLKALFEAAGLQWGMGGETILPLLREWEAALPV